MQSKTEDRAGKQKVLIIDDVAMLRRSIRRHLATMDVEIFEANNGTQGLQLIGKERPDLVILDIMMPGMDGYEVCRQIKSSPLSRDIYVIFCSAKANEEDQAIGIQHGADNYLGKPFAPEEFLAKVQKGLEIAKNKNRIYLDPLTGLLNQSYFVKRYSEELQREARYQHGLSLALCSLLTTPVDDDASSIVYHDFALILQQNFRKIDILARLVDNKFAILMININRKDTNQLLERLVQVVNHHEFPEEASIQLRMGAAISEEFPESLYEQAKANLENEKAEDNWWQKN